MVAHDLASFFVDGVVENVASVFGVRFEGGVDHGRGRDRADGVVGFLEVDECVVGPARNQRTVLGLETAHEGKEERAEGPGADEAPVVGRGVRGIRLLWRFWAHSQVSGVVGIKL